MKLFVNDPLRQRMYILILTYRELLSPFQLQSREASLAADVFVSAAHFLSCWWTSAPWPTGAKHSLSESFPPSLKPCAPYENKRAAMVRLFDFALSVAPPSNCWFGSESRLWSQTRL